MGYFAKKRRLNKILTSNTKTGVSKYSVKLKNEKVGPEDDSIAISKKVKLIKPDKVKENLIKKHTPPPNESKPSTSKLDTLLPNRSQPSVGELDTKEYEGYCLFLSLTSDYIIGYRTFIQSFIEHNKWFSGDILIMALDLNDNQKEYVKSFHKKIKFIEPLYENYKDVNTSKLVNPGFVNNYYKLDIFSYTKYEKIVSMDCDMLITGDISELFFEKYSFGACEVAFSRYWDVPPFNGGLIVLDSKRNSIENYSSVLNKIDKPYRYAEQELLNEIFKKSYTKINKTYNVKPKRGYYNYGDDIKSTNPENLIEVDGDVKSTEKTKYLITHRDHPVRKSKNINILSGLNRTKNGIPIGDRDYKKIRPTNYDPRKIYGGRKICLLGSGRSVEDYDIDYDYYDIIIGLNQVYKTKYINIIDIMYHGISVDDVDFLNEVNNIREKVELVLLPKPLNKQIKKLKALLSEYNYYYNIDIHEEAYVNVKSNPLMGLMVLTELSNSGTHSIDIYGFDFYETPYIEGAVELRNHPKYHVTNHDIKANKEYFLDILSNKDNITWFN